MHHSLFFREVPRRRAPLDDMLTRLEPALLGFPVEALLSLWADPPHTEGTTSDDTTSGQIVEACITAWIDRLDVDAAALAHEDSAELSEAVLRQRCTRDALKLIRAQFRVSAGVLVGHGKESHARHTHRSPVHHLTQATATQSTAER